MPTPTEEEMAKKLEEHEKAKREMAGTLKSLLPKQGLKTIAIEGLGTLSYGPLTFEDLIEIEKAKSDSERAITLVFCMLKKADPSLTIQDVRSLPLDVATKIMEALSKHESSSFLQRAQ